MKPFIIFACINNKTILKNTMKTINSSTILKVSKSKVISNDIKFIHNNIKYSVIYDIDFILQAVNDRGEHVRIAKILINN